MPERPISDWSDDELRDLPIGLAVSVKGLAAEVLRLRAVVEHMLAHDAGPLVVELEERAEKAEADLAAARARLDDYVDGMKLGREQAAIVHNQDYQALRESAEDAERENREEIEQWRVRARRAEDDLSAWHAEHIPVEPLRWYTEWKRAEVDLAAARARLDDYEHMPCEECLTYAPGAEFAHLKAEKDAYMDRAFKAEAELAAARAELGHERELSKERYDEIGDLEVDLAAARADIEDPL